MRNNEKVIIFSSSLQTRCKTSKKLVKHNALLKFFGFWGGAQKQKLFFGGGTQKPKNGVSKRMHCRTIFNPISPRASRAGTPKNFWGDTPKSFGVPPKNQTFWGTPQTQKASLRRGAKSVARRRRRRPNREFDRTKVRAAMPVVVVEPTASKRNDGSVVTWGECKAIAAVKH